MKLLIALMFLAVTVHAQDTTQTDSVTDENGNTTIYKTSCTTTGCDTEINPRGPDYSNVYDSQKECNKAVKKHNQDKINRYCAQKGVVVSPDVIVHPIAATSITDTIAKMYELTPKELLTLKNRTAKCNDAVSSHNAVAWQEWCPLNLAEQMYLITHSLKQLRTLQAQIK